ncbi:MAG: Na/Pi cotransporter family protein [Firmicutes bacterium]|nr:Na/Pi cotransporter family protein [Bacillota bacterium]
MDIFDVLNLIGGLCLFLFGMNLMGAALEKRAGHQLTSILGRLTSSKTAGFFTGLGVTAIIQSSSATTVMVVGFVNSGLMTLKQAINVIMGANVGTTVTAWILSLTGIEKGNFFVQMLKPSSFTPILALIGIVLLMGSKSSKKKDTATILLGFATLMFGMETMSDSVAGLKEVEGFRNILVMFSNPILGVLAGALLTAIIQSSSASVGILQALSSTGQITFGAAIPIIMGQNIGTCITALLSSIGTNRNARRASAVHLCFNIIGTAILLGVFCIARAAFDISAFTNSAASEWGIALAHTSFNLICTAILLPMTGLLEKLSYLIVPEVPEEKQEERIQIDERLMATPAIALERCRVLTHQMCDISLDALRMAVDQFRQFDEDKAAKIRSYESLADHYEDVLGSYLVKLNSYSLSDDDSNESAKLLHMIGDLERISDHAVNVLEAAEEKQAKQLEFSPQAQKELQAMFGAVLEAVDLSAAAYKNNDLHAAAMVEPLEQIVDVLKAQLRSQHILRLQKGECSIEAGFIWSDLLTDLERVSDHCSNIAGCVIELSHRNLNLHDYLRSVRLESSEYAEVYDQYAVKYLQDIENAE